MNRADNEVPVRIVKKKSGHAGHHGGAWKVAYADFVTAMMSLFIVLWIVGQSKQVKQYVANYFKDPGAFFESTKGGGMFQGSNLVGKEQILDEYLRRDEQKLKEMTESILKNLGKDQSVSKLIDQIKIDTVEEGMRIELLEATKAYFFDVGTATLKPEATRVLSIIAAEVGKLPNKVIVEGHTDSRPYSRADGYTNFELSAERANSARRVLVVNGVKEHQIDEVRGYADTRLRDAKDPFDITNRRISIIIEWQDGKRHGSK
ncbi:MAG TPA: flagellar motor protein MotB [Bacteroidota bacterium]|nr:flagellar motor protein MotB [Bacteroidota bacterium]